jgi:hypothetical protein
VALDHYVRLVIIEFIAWHLDSSDVSAAFAAAFSAFSLADSS